jgi:hypothetical protein
MTPLRQRMIEDMQVPNLAGAMSFLIRVGAIMIFAPGGWWTEGGMDSKQVFLRARKRVRKAESRDQRKRGKP